MDGYVYISSPHEKYQKQFCHPSFRSLISHHSDPASQPLTNPYPFQLQWYLFLPPTPPTSNLKPQFRPQENQKETKQPKSPNKRIKLNPSPPPLSLRHPSKRPHAPTRLLHAHLILL